MNRRDFLWLAVSGAHDQAPYARRPPIFGISWKNQARRYNQSRWMRARYLADYICQGW